MMAKLRMCLLSMKGSRSAGGESVDGERSLSPDLIIHTGGPRAIQSSLDTVARKPGRTRVFHCAAKAEGAKALLHGLIQRVKYRSQSGHAGARRGPAAVYRVCAGKPGDPGASEVAAGYAPLAQPREALRATRAVRYPTCNARRPAAGTGPDRRGRSSVPERCN